MSAASTEPSSLSERFFRLRHGRYDLEDSQASLLADIHAAVRRILVSIRRCTLDPESSFYPDLKKALVEAVQKGVALRIFSCLPENEFATIRRLVDEVRADCPESTIILKHFSSEEAEVDLGFYGRIVDERIVEVNEGQALCAQGAHVRTWGTGAATKRSIQLRRAVDTPANGSPQSL